jgi:hypothetical protein
MSHLHVAATAFVGRRQKTAKTCCDKRVSIGFIAIGVDATCPECRKARDEELADYLNVSKCMRDRKVDSTELDKAIENMRPTLYQTVYFL